MEPHSLIPHWPIQFDIRAPIGLNGEYRVHKAVNRVPSPKTERLKKQHRRTRALQCSLIDSNRQRSRRQGVAHRRKLWIRPPRPRRGGGPNMKNTFCKSTQTMVRKLGFTKLCPNCPFTSFLEHFFRRHCFQGCMWMTSLICSFASTHIASLDVVDQSHLTGAFGMSPAGPWNLNSY